MERMQTRGVALPYVLLENHTLIHNHFLIPFRLLKIRLEIWNKQVMVGRVLYDGELYMPPFGKRPLKMEVRLSHVTALFNLLRFVLTDKVQMDIRGDMMIRIFWMTFRIPVDDQLDIPREKFKLLMEDFSGNEKGGLK